MDKSHFSNIGKLGAARFWERFNTDPVFRQKMGERWKNQVFDLEQKRKAAKKGATALWYRYNSTQTPLSRSG